MVSDIFRLPLRTVVASSSAIRSSRSAQQLPPRSAALAEPAPTSPRAAATAKRLLAFISAPFICVSKVLFALTEAARVGVLPRIRTATLAPMRSGRGPDATHSNATCYLVFRPAPVAVIRWPDAVACAVLQVAS